MQIGSAALSTVILLFLVLAVIDGRFVIGIVETINKIFVIVSSLQYDFLPAYVLIAATVGQMFLFCGMGLIVELAVRI